ncbi:MAG: creatininase family protein [Deltaproteobacteria bacterium]|nr:creatininase family protein [Deltaproteobacteria bacterium]
MADQEVMLAKLTRREFREATEAKKFQAAIIPVGSNEQHSEHLAMEHDIASAAYIAREAAKSLYPKVIVSMPIAIGISEHHMHHKGTVSAKPGSWLAVLFDAVESLARHGVKNILILNGHGGNTEPLQGAIQQWWRYFKNTAPGLNLHFCSYWDLIPKDLLEKHMKTREIPGHAKEFETSLALALFPENVRHEAMHDQADKDPLEATAEKGWLFAKEGVLQVAHFLEGTTNGRIRPPEFKYFP